MIIQEEQIFYSRDVQKGDARPGGYVTTGGHGGILGNISPRGPVLVFLPARCHTYLSQVNVGRLPAPRSWASSGAAARSAVPVAVKNAQGELLGEAIPQVTIVKSGNYHADITRTSRSARWTSSLGSSKTSPTRRWRAS